MFEALIALISASTALIAGMLFSPRCISTMPWTMSSLLSWPATPSRGWKPTFTCATSPSVTGAPWLGDSTTLRIWSTDWIRPTPRTMAAWGPKLTVWPPTLTLLLFSAASTCGRASPWATRRWLSTATS